MSGRIVRGMTGIRRCHGDRRRCTVFPEDSDDPQQRFCSSLSIIQLHIDQFRQQHCVGSIRHFGPGIGRRQAEGARQGSRGADEYEREGDGDATPQVTRAKNVHEHEKVTFILQENRTQRRLVGESLAGDEGLREEEVCGRGEGRRLRNGEQQRLPKVKRIVSIIRRGQRNSFLMNPEFCATCSIDLDHADVITPAHRRSCATQT